MTRYAVTTWADGYARWWARVDVSPWQDSGNFDPTNARAAARRAIRREIAERMAPHSTLAPVRLIVESNDITPQNHLVSLTYREAWEPGQLD